MSLTHTFRSADTGAPSASNTAGGLITVLDAVLVNGYNSKTVTITRSGTTATINCTTHGFRDGQILAISGANESDYNITARCAYVDANNVTYQVANSPTTPATGTITAIVAGAGWTKAYSGTNKAAYLQPASADTRFYLRVDDTATADAQARGYELMTDVDTGTNPFPTTTQFALGAGLYLYKGGGTTRSWRAIVHEGTLWLMVRASATPTWTDAGGYGATLYFGNFESFVPVDAYNCMISAQDAITQNGSSDKFFIVGASSVAVGNYLARGYGQVAGASTMKKNTIRHMNVSATYLGSTGSAYPDAVFGGAIMDKITISESTDLFRGTLRGVYTWSHSTGFGIGNTFTAAAGTSLAGKKFEMIESRTNYGALCIQTSDDW